MSRTIDRNRDCLVLVHGALTDSTFWAPHRDRLAGDFDILTPTLRHFGGAATGSFGLNTHAQDIADLLAGMPTVRRLFVAGWSYGADVVLNMLIRHAVPVTKACLYEPGYPGCLQNPQLEAWQSDANAMFGKVFELHAAGEHEQAVMALIDGSGSRAGYFADQPDSAKSLQLSKAHTLAFQLNATEQPAIDVTGVANVRTPMAIAYGATTRSMFRLVAVQTARASPLAELTEIPGAGHMWPQDNPDAFCAYIRRVMTQSG